MVFGCFRIVLCLELDLLHSCHLSPSCRKFFPRTEAQSNKMSICMSQSQTPMKKDQSANIQIYSNAREIKKAASLFKNKKCDTCLFLFFHTRGFLQICRPTSAGLCRSWNSTNGKGCDGKVARSDKCPK